MPRSTLATCAYALVKDLGGPRAALLAVVLAACAGEPVDDEASSGADAVQVDVEALDSGALGVDVGGAGSTDSGANSECPTGKPCDDGDPCTTGDKCIGGTCFSGIATQCDPSKDTDCTFARCVSADGGCVMANRADGLLCDDGEPCTVTANCKDGKCAAGPTTSCNCKKLEDCAKLEDGNLCNGTLYCALGQFPWTCKVDPSSIVDCTDKASPCTFASCDGKTGKCVISNKDDGAVCEDGDICTKNESCAAGECKAELNVCTCTSTADCALLDDDDLCNGKLYCDLKHKDANGDAAPKCKVNPASVVKCNADNDTTCAKAACQPKTGSCLLEPVDASCDDGNSCTTGDKCVIGKCIPGTNTCICKSDADCKAKDDGDFCNGTMFCNQKNGECEINPTTVVSCPTVNDTTCIYNTCKNLYPGGDTTQLPTGATCTMTPVLDTLKKACSDNDPCTSGDVCEKGACKAGTFTCYCKSDEDCLKEDDGDLCNGVLFCNKATGKCQEAPSSVVKCDTVDNTQCAFKECKPKTGKCAMTLKTDGDTCEDGSVCTSGDYCLGGKCTPNKFTCQCKADADCAGSDDGDKCNGTFFCDTSKDKPVCKHNAASIVFCKKDEDTACVKNQCDSKTGACGLKPVAELTKCEDGDACTTSDYCKGGECRSGTSVCECQTNADCAKKDDGNLCNGVPYCDTSIAGKFTCKPNPASQIDCSKKNDTQCTKNTCDPKTGQCNPVNLKKGVPCNDGDLCTASETCDGGECKNGTFTCKCKTNADCLAQDDGDLCNGVPYCDTSAPGKNVCKPNPNSKVFCPQNVNTQCLQNRCNGKTGKCSLQPFSDGKACDDGDKCSVSDKCAAGKCAAGSKLNCDDKNACTADSCDAKTGCAHVLANCKDGNSCTVDKCEPATGKCDFATLLKDGSGCDADGSGCTVNDACKKGACKAGPEVVCELPLKKCQKAICKSEGATQFKCVVGNQGKGASCDDENSCTIGATCDAAGKCVAGKESRLWSHVVADPNANFRLAGARPSPDRTVIFGVQEVLANGAVTKEVLYAHAIDATGKANWAKPLTVDAKAPAQRLGFWAADKRGNGDWMLAGTTVDNTGARAAIFVLAQWDGKKKTVQVHRKWEESTVWDGIKLNDNGMLLTGSTKDSGKQYALMMRLSASGHLSWATKGDIEGEGPHAIAPLAGDESVVVGNTPKQADGISRAHMVRWDAKGAPVWRRVIGPSSGITDAVLRDVVTRPNEAITAVGTLTDSGGDHYWIVRTDRTGKVLWERKSAGQAEAWSIEFMASNQMFIAGRAPDGSGGKDAWAMLIDPIGNPTWQKNFENLDGAGSSGAVQLVGGESQSTGFALVGYRNAKPDRSFVTRISAWGHQSCEEGGDCASVKFDACDDKQPCTLDTCDAKTGQCQHAAINGLVCDPEDGCTVYGVCTNNKCVADPNGKLWARQYSWYSASTGPEWHYTYSGVGALAGTADGGALVIGHRHKNQYPKWYHSGSNATLRRLDHTGALLWSKSYSSQDPNSFDGGKKWVMERLNGEVWFGYSEQTSANGYGRASKIFRYTAAGDAIGSALNWAEVIQSGQRGIDAIAEHDDGSTGYTMLNVFYRRDSKLSSKLSKTMPSVDGKQPRIQRLAAIPDGRWIAAGSTGAGGYVAKLAADGAAQWAQAHDQLSGYVMREVRVAPGGAVYAAGYSTAATHKRKFVVARHSELNGLLNGLIEVAKHPEGATPFTSIGPDGGFAFAVAYGSGTNHTVKLFTADYNGAFRYQRDLLAGTEASIHALAAAANDGILYGGRSIDSGGKRKTRIAKAGAWGMAPCPNADKCMGVDLKDCADSDPCTLDICQPDAGCVHKALKCDDGNACTKDSCDKSKGCIFAGITCDDGLTCTNDVCNAVGGGGVKEGCEFPLKAICDDGTACTIDTCETGSKCVNTKVDCDDKDACTTDWCDKVKGCKHSNVTCNDSEPCTLDTCNKVTGCVFTKLSDGAVCEDNQVCSVLGKGICKNLKCTHGGTAYKGCTSKTPAKSCVEAKTQAAGKLDNYIGWTWLDEDGDGKDEKLQWCDMKAGAYKLLYSNGVTRAKNAWGPGAPGTCTGGAASKDLWSPPAINVKWNKGTTDVTVNAALDVPQDHTRVRVRFVYHIQTPNSTYTSWAKVQVHLSGTKVFDGSAGGLPKTWSGNPKSPGTCTNGPAGNIQGLQGDYNVPHTDKTVALAIRSYSTASNIFYTWPIGDVEVWVK